MNRHYNFIWMFSLDPGSQTMVHIHASSFPSSPSASSFPFVSVCLLVSSVFLLFSLRLHLPRAIHIRAVLLTDTMNTVFLKTTMRHKLIPWHESDLRTWVLSCRTDSSSAQVWVTTYLSISRLSFFFFLRKPKNMLLADLTSPKQMLCVLQMLVTGFTFYLMAAALVK